MEKKSFNENITLLTRCLQDLKLTYDESIKLFIFLTVSALAEDKVNAETNKEKYLEVFNQVWSKYRDEFKANS